MASKKKGKDPVASEMDWAEVDRVVKLMARHGLEEFEYSDGSFHVRLKKISAGQSVAPGASPGPPPPASLPSDAGDQAHATAEAQEAPHVVKSPIVGTFYGAPTPGAPPFVKVGDTVKVGQVLCIIEAMKLMNEIEADAVGEITRVFVENAQPVEYGEPLFAIRPNALGPTA